ncbi:histidine-rich glycoprotein-like [Atheta coriaria]|uniref:histidine-rich glycoprotein-like n=1 Tax=Dalotia coriaria TaxID=877792 RepID=UPI0031F34605
MFVKVCILAAVVACAVAQHHATSYASVSNHVVHGDHHGGEGLGQAQEGGHHGHHEEHYPHHHPKYEFKYGVEDKHTHDIKSQHEERDGDVVKGYYTLVQPDAVLSCVFADHHHASSYASYDNHVEHSYHHGEDEHGHKEYFHHPKYVYKYGVEDPHTHDMKSAEEERDGDVVKGYYSVVQPDGKTRIVHYTADKHNGFKAEVHYTDTHHY